MSQDKLNSTDRFVGGLENIDGNLRAAGAISAGDPVEFDGTETGNVPDVSLATTDGGSIAGIALVDAAAAGDPVTVAQTGAEVRANFSGTGGVPGDQLVAAGNGSVIAHDDSGASAGDVVAGVAKSVAAGGEIVMLVNGGGDFHG